MQRKVCIVGAGPAGITTALFLAKNGIHSTIIEKSKFPRDKICGDAFSGKVSWVLNKLDIEFDKKIASKSFLFPSWGVKFFGSTNNELKVPFAMDYDPKEDIAPGFIASRMDFDNFLFEVAKENPLIEIFEEKTLVNFERKEDSILCSTKNKEFEIEANLLIAANGPYSKIAKDLMSFEIDDDSNSLGLRTYYKGVEGLDQEGYIELHFLKELLPGYFWIFPMANGLVNVGAGVRTDLMRKNKMNLKKSFKDIIQNHPTISKRFQNAALVDEAKLFGLPLGSKKRKLSSDNLLLVGDSGALIDPFTGEGIGNAMISGMLAAIQIEKSLITENYSEEYLIDYDRMVYKRLQTELLLSKKLQDLSVYPFLLNFVINKARKSKDLQELISSMVKNVNIREKLKNPMFYLRILFS